MYHAQCILNHGSILYFGVWEGLGGECCFLGNKVKKTMSKCHIPERSHVTKPLLLSNNVIISPTEHAQ